MAIVWMHAFAVPAFGIASGYTPLHAAAESLAIALAGVVATWGPLSRTMRALAVSVGLLSASALLVHFSGGYIEFHFHFFVMIALLSLYQHWLPFLAAVAYVALHHGLAGALDPDAVYNHPDAVDHPWKWAGIHAAFVLGAGAANVFTWRLSEDEQRRRRDLERVTEAALAHLPLRELLDEVLSRVREVLGADTATIFLREVEGTLAAYAFQRQAGDASVSVETAVASRVMRERRAVVSEEVGGGGAGGPAGPAWSIAGVPMIVEGTSIGVLTVGVPESRCFSSAELGLLQLVADRIAPTVDRARLHEHEHRVAETLQRSLLPKALPAHPGLRLAFRYQPAGQTLAVGGDWYDAMLLPGGKFGLVMGDVVGHGIDAASLMGQLRTGLRAYALAGSGPGEVLSRLNELTLGLGEANMATLLYLELDPDSGLVRYASAGHLPAVVAAPSGAVRRLDATLGAPLGVAHGRQYAEAEATLEPGATLALCTDGLVESRLTGIDEGLEALERVIGQSAEIDVQELCDRILEEVPPSRGVVDDVALLVVRLVASLDETLELHYPAEPESAAAMRRTLERWLAERGVREDDAYAIVAASSEAAANTIEHAYGPADGAFRLTADRQNREVTVTIADSGSWRPSRRHDRGRGTGMMKLLVDSVEVTRGPDGTTVRMQKHLSGDSRGRSGR